MVVILNMQCVGAKLLLGLMGIRRREPVVEFTPGPSEETCDRCKKRVTAFETYFDGTGFFCPDCRDGVSATS